MAPPVPSTHAVAALSAWLLINGAGAVATGCTVIIVLVAKFVEGAWITVALVPLLILLMRSVHRHYVHVAQDTKVSGISLVSSQVPPLAIVPVSAWNHASEAALQFACSLTPQVQVLHIECSGEDGHETSEHWQHQMNDAAEQSGLTAPEGCVPAISVPLRHIAYRELCYRSRDAGMGSKDRGGSPGTGDAALVPIPVAQPSLHCAEGSSAGAGQSSNRCYQRALVSAMNSPTPRESEASLVMVAANRRCSTSRTKEPPCT